MEKNIHWGRVVIHEVSIQLFTMNEDLELLKNEIKIFNSYLKLMKKPSWLCLEETK